MEVLFEISPALSLKGGDRSGAENAVETRQRGRLNPPKPLLLPYFGAISRPVMP